MKDMVYEWCMLSVLLFACSNPPPCATDTGVIDSVCSTVLSTPEQVDFGIVNIGDRQEHDIVLENIGCSSLTIYDFSMEDDSLPVFSVEATTPAHIVAHSSITFGVAFQPDHGGVYYGSVIIKSSDTTTEIPLFGSGN
jgi:hypothetical protein